MCVGLLLPCTLHPQEEISGLGVWGSSRALKSFLGELQSCQAFMCEMNLSPKIGLCFSTNKLKSCLRNLSTEIKRKGNRDGGKEQTVGVEKIKE